MKHRASHWGAIASLAGCQLAMPACSSPAKGPASMFTDELPVKKPEWTPLNIPQSKVTLPAFITGAQRQLSSGCWQAAPVIQLDSADALAWKQEHEKEFDANLKAAFSKYLVTVGLDASLASAFKQQSTTELGKISLDTVDPANIRPNFANPNCTEPELEWLADGRLVVTQAVKTEKVTVSAKLAISTEQKAKVEAAIQSFNAEFKSGFSNLTVNNEEFSMSATNVYIGAIGTTLKASDCSLKTPAVIPPDTLVALCDARYKFEVKPSSIGGRYSLSVTPANGATATFDEAYGSQIPRQVGELRLVSALARPEGSNIRIESLSILMVRASGAE